MSTNIQNSGISAKQAQNKLKISAKHTLIDAPATQNYFLQHPFRVPVGIAHKVLEHKDRKAIFFFLELKSLFVNSIIFAESRRLPYAKIATILKLSQANVRNKIKTLNKLELVIIDDDRNINLSKYKTLAEAFGSKSRRKRTVIKSDKQYKKGDFSFLQVLNPQEQKQKYILTAEQAVRAVALQENFKRQEHAIKTKIINKEIKNIVAESQIAQNLINSRGCCASIESEVRNMSKQRKNKLKKCIDYDQALEKQKRLYEKQIQQVALGKPFINPNVSLSCAGTAFLFGGSGIASTGHYQQRRLAQAGLIGINAMYMLIDDGNAVNEQNDGTRGDVFSYKYPSRRDGWQRKYFIRMPNEIIINQNQIS